MAAAQHIPRRGGIYHLRCHVPCAFVSVARRGEIHRPLSTACPKEARKPANRLFGRIMAIFDELRAMTGDAEDQIAELLALSVEDKDHAIA